MSLADQLEAHLAPRLAEQNIELVAVEHRREPAGWTLRFFLDKPGGITLEDCARLSHTLDLWVEECRLITGPYRLEVSSPGLDRPLRKREDFIRFSGSEAVVHLFAPHNGQRHFHGRITGVEGEDLQLTDRTSGEVKLPLSGVAGARLAPEFKFD